MDEMHDAPPRSASGPIAGQPWGEAIHATAVAVSGSGLLILGPSGSGKSRLAFALITADPRHIRLVGDDRILLAAAKDRVVARPHPRIAGFIERRGLGIVACPCVTAAAVHGVVRLKSRTSVYGSGPTTLSAELAENFSALPFVILDEGCRPEARRDIVMSWCATLLQHSP